MMKRRKVIQYIGFSALTTIGAMVLSPQSYQAQTASKVEITWLGHTVFCLVVMNIGF